MEPVVQSATERLFQYGILGVLVVVFGVVIYFLWRSIEGERKDYMKLLTDQHELRVKDAQAIQAQLLEITRQSTTAINTVATLVDATKETMGEVRDTLRELGDEVRSRTPRSRG